jgi:DNA-binding LacI/PurR family transcriptional regulator
MAMDRLAAEGFIRSDGRHGTFVHDQPPHLTDIAVVFPSAPVVTNHFWVALDNTIKSVPFSGFKLTCWYGVDAHVDNAVYTSLCERVDQGSLAGLLFVTSPFYFLKSPLLVQRPGIPRIAFASKWRHSGAAVSTIDFKHASFAERAVARLAQNKRRRLAIITYPDDPYEAWLEICERHGIELRPYWFQGVSQTSPGTGRNLARLLFREGQKDRPDALIVADDNLLEPITLGLVDAGMRVPKDVSVLAHCNFPWPTKSAVPVTRLGWDTRGILELALNVLDQTRRKSSTTHSSVDAVFEEEI